MGYERPGLEVGFLPSDEDFTNDKPANGDVGLYSPVWVGAAANVTGQGAGGASVQKVGAKTTPPLGILQNCPQRGEAALVMVSGVCKVRAAGTWAVGDLLGWNASGKVIKAVAGKQAFGLALESAVANDVVACLLVPLSGGVPA